MEANEWRTEKKIESRIRNEMICDSAGTGDTDQVSKSNEWNYRRDNECVHEQS